MATETRKSYGSGSGTNPELYIVEVRTILDRSISLGSCYEITRKWSRFPFVNAPDGALQAMPGVSIAYKFPSLHFIEAHEKLFDFEQAYAMAVWLETHFDRSWITEEGVRRSGPIEARLVKVKLEYSYSVTEEGVGPLISTRGIYHAMADKFVGRDAADVEAEKLGRK